MTIEKYQNQVNSKRKSSKSSRGRKYEDTDPSAGTEVGKSVLSVVCIERD